MLEKTQEVLHRIVKTSAETQSNIEDTQKMLDRETKALKENDDKVVCDIFEIREMISDTHKN